MPPIEPHKLRWLQLQLQLEEAEERERAIFRDCDMASPEPKYQKTTLVGAAMDPATQAVWPV